MGSRTEPASDTVAAVGQRFIIVRPEHAKPGDDGRLQHVAVGAGPPLLLFSFKDPGSLLGNKGSNIGPVTDHAAQLGCRSGARSPLLVVAAAEAQHRHGLHVKAQLVYGLQIFHGKNIVGQLKLG